jgi:hypothetical protein
MEKRRKKRPGKRDRGKYNPDNLCRQKALAIVGAFCAYWEKTKSQINILGLHRGQVKSPLRNMLHDLSWKVKLEISTGRTKKYPSGNPLQISNTEGWY